jgi:hypothetical protein
MSSSATATPAATAAAPASAATSSATTMETTAAATAGALISATATTSATVESTATPGALELLAARRTAIGEGSRLRPIAGVERRALRGNVAASGTTAKLRRAEIGALS